MQQLVGRWPSSISCRCALVKGRGSKIARQLILVTGSPQKSLSNNHSPDATFSKMLSTVVDIARHASVSFTFPRRAQHQILQRRPKPFSDWRLVVLPVLQLSCAELVYYA